MGSSLPQQVTTDTASNHELLRECAIEAIRIGADAVARHTRALDHVVQASAYDPVERPWGLSQRALAELSGYCRPRVKKVIESRQSVQIEG